MLRPRLRTLLVALALVTASAAGVRAQDTRLDVTPPPVASAAEGATVVTRGLLGDERIRDMIRNGFPAQLRCRLELWRSGGLFQDLETSTTWAMIVQYDPSDSVYRVARAQGGRLELVGSFQTLRSAQLALERPYRAGLAPSGHGRRYYYNFVVDVEVLSVSDLAEIGRWVKGELRPAVRGEGNPASALANGIRTLLARALGGTSQHYERQSTVFTAP